MAALSDRDRVSLKQEIGDCERVRSWSSRAQVRSSWLPELRAILQADDVLRDALELDDLDLVVEAEDALEDAMRAACERARGLAQTKATQYARDKALVWAAVCTAIGDDDSESESDVAESMSVAEMVAAARAAGVRIDDSLSGARDGFVIDDRQAVAYASCRWWKWGAEYGCDFVEVQLVPSWTVTFAERDGEVRTVDVDDADSEEGAYLAAVEHVLRTAERPWPLHRLLAATVGVAER